MKKLVLLLGLLCTTICLTACISGNSNMTFDEAIDSIFHPEITETIKNADSYKQDFNISSKFSVPENNVDANVSFSTSTRQNVKDSMWETEISVKIDASWDGDEWRETITLDGNAIVKYLPRGIYFKLNTLNLKWPDDFISEDDLNLSWVKNQWFSFELTDEMMKKIYWGEIPEDISLKELYNEKDFKVFENNIKKAFVNEWSLVYKGKYSKFKWSKARRFSIDKKKAYNAVTEYIKSVIPEESKDEYLKSLEETDINEVLKDSPFKNFEWYIVITSKWNIQIVIENLDIEDEYSKTKIRGTFGREVYELVVKTDGEDVFTLSAKFNKSRYNLIVRFSNSEILKWTLTPKQSKWAYSMDFDVAINLNMDEKVKIPLKWSWSRKKIDKFNVTAPKDATNLLENMVDEMMSDPDFDPATLQVLVQSMNQKHNLSMPIMSAWILAASLAPRMQSAQNRARDVARKSDLSQIQTAIITSQYDKWMWPGMNNWATKWIPASTIEKDLMDAWMYSVPTDPVNSNKNRWLWENYKNKPAIWEYLYLVTQRNSVKNGWFVLMAKTEVEWASNWIVCNGKEWLQNGYINNNTDLANVKLCRYLTKWDTCSSNADECTYTSKDELRYIILY